MLHFLSILCRYLYFHVSFSSILTYLDILNLQLKQTNKAGVQRECRECLSCVQCQVSSWIECHMSLRLALETSSVRVVVVVVGSIRLRRVSHDGDDRCLLPSLRGVVYRPEYWLGQHKAWLYLTLHLCSAFGHDRSWKAPDTPST